MDWIGDTFSEQMETLSELIRTVEPIVVAWSIPPALAISMLMGIGFGVYPAMRAARLDPLGAHAEQVQAQRDASLKILHLFEVVQPREHCL